MRRVGWSDGTIWLDAAKTNARAGHRAMEPGTVGFQSVPEEVWDFNIGGYQVCNKWLKDRKGRALTAEDVVHYQKIIVALNETVRIMAEIDEIIEAHGGWPDAFQATSYASRKPRTLAKVAESSRRTARTRTDRRGTEPRPRSAAHAVGGIGPQNPLAPGEADLRTQRRSPTRRSEKVVPMLFLKDA